MSWRDQLAGLSDHYRVVAPDLRGYGGTDAPPRVRDYTIDRLTRDVVELIDALGVERVHLVGHDWGGAIAWEVAQRHGDRLLSLSVLNCPPMQMLVRELMRFDQLRRSWYFFFFQVPFVPEWQMQREPEIIAKAFWANAVNKNAFTARAARAIHSTGARAQAGRRQLLPRGAAASAAPAPKDFGADAIDLGAARSSVGTVVRRGVALRVLGRAVRSRVARRCRALSGAGGRRRRQRGAARTLRAEGRMTDSVIVIGAGRIGTALAARAREQFVLVDRERGWEHLDPARRGPILLAVRNDDLSAVLERIPAARHKDLVFVQNGMLRPWLEERRLAMNTRGLLFMAVPSVGAPIEPGGESPFWGPMAPAMVEAFTKVGLPAKVVDAQAFTAIELEKLIWSCAFGLFCQALDCDVGTVVEQHRPRLRLLVNELLNVGGPALGVQLELEPLVERLCVYSRSIPTYRGAVKEWPWRNGWFVSTARKRKQRTPTHDMLLLAIGKFGR